MTGLYGQTPQFLLLITPLKPPVQALVQIKNVTVFQSINSIGKAHHTNQVVYLFLQAILSHKVTKQCPEKISQTNCGCNSQKYLQKSLNAKTLVKCGSILEYSNHSHHSFRQGMKLMIKDSNLSINKVQLLLGSLLLRMTPFQPKVTLEYLLLAQTV